MHNIFYYLHYIFEIISNFFDLFHKFLYIFIFPHILFSLISFCHPLRFALPSALFYCAVSNPETVW